MCDSHKSKEHCKCRGKKGDRGAKGKRGHQGKMGQPGPQGPAGPPGPGCMEPLPIATQIVYVNKAGNDASADGSECHPFLTVTAAMASIVDASPTKRYEISIGPGTYSEPFIHLKANVQLVGASTLLTRLDIPFDINDPSWNGNLNVDNRAGFADLALLTGPLDFDFRANTFTPSTGRLFFVSVNISPTPVFTGNSTFLSQINIRDCQLFGGYTQNGANVYMFASYVGGVPLPLSQPTITINSIVPYDTQVHLIGGGTDGDVIVNAPPGTVPIDPFDLLSFAIKGNLIINGTNARPRATVDSIPVRARVIGSALIERLNDANGLGYTPSNLGDWVAPPPTTVQEALDRIAAQIGPVIP
ncbi:exosporium leader peptide [Paenibacillus hexagrammi]|uniref:Exosporium leader peptide n=1 Tax=Paenibacillus hexagrammi TaxID=2908839 RepID=A0ABY3SEL0_9BACL|nr:exosporium leader peptide [Paenibacillus sp. YPD9-1]UJF31858.1 exosporium leader peptide [Paenibacillus sp. YPD9-1]